MDDRPNERVDDQDGGLRLSKPQLIFWVVWAWEVGVRAWMVVMVVGERERVLQMW